MKEYFKNFKKVIKDIKDRPDVTEKLKKIQTGLEKCSGKMGSACLFIDFFVHDILDYTLLNKESKNFMKDSKTFDMPEAIKEITEILADKSSLKNIKVMTHFKGFNGIDLVNTDRKRIQQVILNLLSNAVKFTDRGGKILVLVEKIGLELRVSVTDTGLGIKKKD
jgi:signal transduction histidine kinase